MMAPSTMLSGGTGSLPNAGDLVALAGRLQLDRLDGARADVQADQGFRSAKHRDVLSCDRATGYRERADRHRACRQSDAHCSANSVLQFIGSLGGKRVPRRSVSISAELRNSGMAAGRAVGRDDSCTRLTES